MCQSVLLRSLLAHTRHLPYIPMVFAVALWRIVRSFWARPAPARTDLPAGWRVADERRDIFAEYCEEFLKDDLLLWARIVLPASNEVSEVLRYYAETWGFLCSVQRLDAQNFLKGVKAAYLKALDLRTPSN